MLVELKSGETLNGLLVNCDTWMNLTLREVVQTSADGDKFMRLPEIYVRGSTVSPGACRRQWPALTRRRSNTFECLTRLSSWSKSSRLRTKRTEAAEVGCTSAETIEAIGAVVACADEGAGAGEAAAEVAAEEEVREAASTSVYHADHRPPDATRDTSMRMPTQQSESWDHEIALVSEAGRRTQRPVLPSEALHVDDGHGALLPCGIGC